MTAIDTLSVQRRLKEAGFADAQATALTDVMREVVSGYAATKGDVQDAKHDLEKQIVALENRMTVKFGLMLGAGLALLFLALQYAPN